MNNYLFKVLRLIVFLFLISVPLFAFGQHYYRIKADFSYKYKGSKPGTSSLVMGTAYFNKVEQKLTYRVNFPKKEVWVMQDTNMYKFEGKVLIEKSFIPSPVETSIFNLTLQSNMNNFALESSAYTLENVEEENGMVIATWNPPPMRNNDVFGKVLVANTHGILTGIVFKNPTGEVVAKQFYESYQHIKGINFPMKVTQIIIEDDTESYQITTYKNVRIDEIGEDYWYNYPLD